MCPPSRPLYIYALTAMIAFVPVMQYMTPNLRGMGPSVFETNLPTIPNRVMAAPTTVIPMYFSERKGQMLPPAVFAQVRVMPPPIRPAVANSTTPGRRQVWGVITAMPSKPMGQFVRGGVLLRRWGSIYRPGSYPLYV